MTHEQRTRAFQRRLAERQAIKVIAGISNFDEDRVGRLVRAADQVSGLGAVDVAAQENVVRLARDNTRLFVFASCIDPENLANTLDWGADGVELGNYDALYEKGIFLDAAEVLDRSRQLMARLEGRDPLVSITVPGHLDTASQVNLARELEALGVDLIQTEGATRRLSREKSVQPLGAAEKFEITLANTQALSRATRLPVMTATGITPENVAMAFVRGAWAVGVGSAVNRLSTETDMVLALTRLVSSAQDVILPPVLQVS